VSENKLQTRIRWSNGHWTRPPRLENAVKVRLHRARSALKQLLAPSLADMKRSPWDGVPYAPIATKAEEGGSKEQAGPSLIKANLANIASKYNSGSMPECPFIDVLLGLSARRTSREDSGKNAPSLG
jgi:hypothetical protein